MSNSYSRFAGFCALAAGIAGLAYLVSFFVLKNPAALVPALALLLVGLFALAALVGLYGRVRAVDDGYALLGLLLGIGGALGAAIHSGFDLSNNLHPPASAFAYANPVDPRGLLTFGIAGLGAIVLSWLIVRGAVLPKGLGYLGVVTGLLLIGLYIAYLVVLDAANPLVLLLVVASGIGQPLWYLWLGSSLLQQAAPAPAQLSPAQAR